MQVYCHNCNKVSVIQGQTIMCQHCGSEFVENDNKSQQIKYNPSNKPNYPPQDKPQPQVTGAPYGPSYYPQQQHYPQQPYYSYPASSPYSQTGNTIYNNNDNVNKSGFMPYGYYYPGQQPYYNPYVPPSIPYAQQAAQYPGPVKENQSVSPTVHNTQKTNTGTTSSSNISNKPPYNPYNTNVKATVHPSAPPQPNSYFAKAQYPGSTQAHPINKPVPGPAHSTIKPVPEHVHPSNPVVQLPTKQPTLPNTTNDSGTHNKSIEVKQNKTTPQTTPLFTTSNVPKDSGQQKSTKLYPTVPLAEDTLLYSLDSLPTVPETLTHLWLNGGESLKEEDDDDDESTNQPENKNSKVPLATNNKEQAKPEQAQRSFWNNFWDSVNYAEKKISNNLEGVQVVLDEVSHVLAPNQKKIWKGSLPAAETAIKDCPMFKIDDDNIKDTQECLICFEPWVVGEEAKMMPCKHFFHPNCIEKWLHTKNSCPICRYELKTDSIRYERFKQRQKEIKEREKAVQEQSGNTSN